MTSPTIKSLPNYLWKICESGHFEPMTQLAEGFRNDLSKNLPPELFLLLKSQIETLVSSGHHLGSPLTMNIRSPLDSQKFIWLDFTVFKDLDGIYVQATDVTKHKEQETFYLQILDSLREMVLVKGEKSKLIWANKSFCKHYGMSNEQLKEIVDAPHNEPDYTQQYVIDDAWVWNNQETLVITCEPVTRFDGVVRKFETVKTPLFDSTGKISRTVGISRDITDKIESEQRSDSASKMAALGEMAGGIAHEINNPLTVISGKARQIRQVIERKTPDKEEFILKGLGTIESLSERIATIVQGLRKFSRDASRDPFESTSVEQIVQDTLVFCREKMLYHGIEFHLNSSLEQKLECQPVQISQILLNLLNNAIDAIDNMSNGNRWIHLDVSSASGFLEMRISDSGPGIPDEIATKIMQPFFTTKEVGKGTGLGLSISTSIAKDHGGTLKLDRSISKSCFVLRLPLYRQNRVPESSKIGEAA